jgi:hypothetical protein
MSDAPMNRSTLRWIVGIGVVSFLGALLLSVFGPDMAPIRSDGNSSYSSSAIGHRALVEVLSRLDMPVVSSRFGSAERAAHRGVLVLAEPLDCAPGTPRAKALREMLEAAGNVLLVLPKWRASRKGAKDGRVETIHLRPEGHAQHPLEPLVDGAVVRRFPVAAGRPLRPTEDSLGFPPTPPLPVLQLVVSDEIEPLVGDGRGILLGEVAHGDTRVLVLSDPDILSNVGLRLGDNAPLALAAISELRPAGGVVVIDETIHGFEREPSIWRELFSFPLVLLIAHGALLVALLLWSGMGRFGAPQREGLARAPGRQSLVGNTAELLRYRGRVGSALTKYYRGALTDARRALRAPKGLSHAELVSWLERMGERRGTTDRIGALRELVAARDATRSSSSHMLAVAGRIHRWRTEILHGPASRTRPS